MLHSSSEMTTEIKRDFGRSEIRMYFCMKSEYIMDKILISGNVQIIQVVIKGDFGSTSTFLMDGALVENHQILIFIAVLVNYISLNSNE